MTKDKIIIGILLCVFSYNSCTANKYFVELDSENIRAPNGIEYTFLANEGFIETFGECNFVGKFRWENAKLQHMGSSINTGMYSCDDDLNILYRIRPDSEWRTYYRRKSLPKIELISEKCNRFEFIHYKNIQYFRNNISPEKRHMFCNEGIKNIEEINLFLNDIKNGKSPQEAGLYRMITKENGMLENCYLIGNIYGYFENESNLAISYGVQSFNDLAYSIETDFGSYVLSVEWLEKLRNKK